MLVRARVQIGSIILFKAGQRAVRNTMQFNKQSQRGYTLLQGLAILAVIGIVVTLILNYFR